MYIFNAMIVRRGKIRLVEGVQHAADSKAAMALVQDEFEPELQELLDPKDAENLSKSVLKHIAGAHIKKKILTKDDLYGALACFWLVFVSCLPAALPFLIFSEPTLALRISNCLMIAGLFYIGQKWARYAGRNRLVIGSAMVAIGLCLVGVAILLGG
jgi:VIT1/CCC1 family predicted Fe2+/Mn2+ transporter